MSINSTLEQCSSCYKNVDSELTTLLLEKIPSLCVISRRVSTSEAYSSSLLIGTWAEVHTVVSLIYSSHINICANIHTFAARWENMQTSFDASKQMHEKVLAKVQIIALCSLQGRWVNLLYIGSSKNSTDKYGLLLSAADVENGSSFIMRRLFNNNISIFSTILT